MRKRGENERKTSCSSRRPEEEEKRKKKWTRIGRR